MEPATHGLNNLDFIILGVVLASGVFALFRGFIREMFSLGAWAGAYFAAARYSPFAEPLVRRYIKSDGLVDIAAPIVVFCLVFMVLTVISNLVCYFIKGRTITAIDRSFGFIFGLLRGALVACIIYFAAITIWWPDIDAPPKPDMAENDKPPALLMEARTRPALAYGASLLESFIPKKEIDKQKQEYEKQKQAAQKMIEEKALDALSTPAPTGGIQPIPTYDDKSRTNLNHLIDQQGKP